MVVTGWSVTPRGTGTPARAGAAWPADASASPAAPVMLSVAATAVAVAATAVFHVMWSVPLVLKADRECHDGPNPDPRGWWLPDASRAPGGRLHGGLSA